MRSLWKSAWRRIGSRSLATEVTVKHLPFAATSDSVGDLFATLKLPAPQKIEVALTTVNKRPKGWAYVSYDNDAEAATAIQTLSGHTYEGRRLQALLRGDPQPAGERKKSPVYKAKGASGDDDFFTELRAQLIHNDDRDAEDERLRVLLREQFHLDDTSISLKDDKSKEKVETGWASVDDGGAAMSAESQKSGKRLRDAAHTQERLSRLKELDAAGSNAQQLPGKWAETIISVDRVTKVTKGGRVMSFRALVVVGNTKGSGGFGVGKAMLPPDAVARAIRDAKKNLIVVDRYKNTGLVHSVEGRHNNCKVVLRAVPPGYGMKGGRTARAILKQFGIADCTAKAVGRRKPFSVVRAIFKALARHESLSTIAQTRGRRIIEMEWRRGAQN